MIKDRFNISADELEHRMSLQEKYHDKPLISVVEFMCEAINKVLKSLGVDISQSDEMVKRQQIDLGIEIVDTPPEQMGELSGFYINSREVPIAIICDPYLANDGLAYLNIMWIQTNIMEKFGGVRLQ